MSKMVIVGITESDGHKRITKSSDFVLFGGTKETHEQMQDAAMKFTDLRKRSGRELHECSKKEVLDLARESGMISD